MHEEMHGDHRYFQQEKKLESTFDQSADQIARKYGYPSVPYESLTQVVLLTYLVITSFAMFYRPDFMSMTAIMIGIYSIKNPQGIKRSVFRMLVVFLLISFFYDFVFLVILHDSDADDEADSAAANVRRFAYFFAWISFAFRPVVIVVFWKDSLNFRKVIRNKSISEAPYGGTSNGMTSKELEIARITALYGGGLH